MDELEQKLGSILGDPQMMQQIMAMAQTLGQSQGPPPRPEEPQPPPPAMPDGAMLQKMVGMVKQSGIDKNQQNLLRALGPYLSRERISKLEKAMRAARMAALASTALRSSGVSLFSGR